MRYRHCSQSIFWRHKPAERHTWACGHKAQAPAPRDQGHAPCPYAPRLPPETCLAFQQVASWGSPGQRMGPPQSTYCAHPPTHNLTLGPQLLGPGGDKDAARTPPGSALCSISAGCSSVRPPTRPTAGVGHGVKSCSVNSWKLAMNPASVDTHTQAPGNPQPNLPLVLLPRLALLPAQLPTSRDSPAPAPQQPALPCEPILPGPHGGIHTSQSPGSPAGISYQPHVEQEPLISPHALLLLSRLPVAATALPDRKSVV